jgi:hypothetical protein
MFIDSDLLDAIENQNTLRISSFILAEFNLNDQENISKIGNYRYRPFSNEGQFLEPISTYDKFDFGDYYTDADISYQEYADTDDEDPFEVVDKSKELYYSLGDCFLPFRPRSGINKARFINNKFIDNVRSGERPRYYMPSRSDYFKYWSSYRKEDGIERGISSPVTNFLGGYVTSDASPFIVYNNPINFNRVVVKMQTNVGSLDLGNIRLPNDSVIQDPLFDYSNATVPLRWKIQTLDLTDTWVDVIEFDENSTRQGGSPIVPKTGHVEIFYGIKIPVDYSSTFRFIDYTQESILPNVGNIPGNAFIVEAEDTPQGLLKIWNGDDWDTYDVEYGWSLYEEDVVEKNGTITKPVDPYYYEINGQRIFREFVQAKGLRIVVKTMNSPSSTFDLIELSPRLLVNMSDYTQSFEISKSLSADQNGLPVGYLTVSNGSLNIDNFDNIFTESNVFDGESGSIVTEHARQNTKFVFYETILDVNGSDKYIPIKTFYAESFPRPSGGTSTISIPLRDLFFRLETTNAPSLLSQETTLTYAVATILDYVGFSNFSFRNIETNNDPILPFFFVEPNISVAEILQRLAQATQTAMFFDEYNNFIVMSKEYLFPSENDRDTDFVLSGNDTPLANIESIASSETKIINDGRIDYTIRYIQREVSSLKSSISIDEERTYKYKPVLLWEVGSTEQTKTVNEASKDASGYSLGAMALNNSLSLDAPTVVNRQIINNVIDVGESVYWLPRFQGYLYASGEIIRFDAVEFAIPGSQDPVVWISNNQDYQKYFGSLPFNGKIYPTGRIRIFTEPFYEDISGVTFIKNGEVRIHGRGQFGTEITSHEAGLPNYWSDNQNTYGVRMASEFLFTTTPTEDISYPPLGSITRQESSAVNEIAKKSKRNGIIKNFMSSKVYTDGTVNSLRTTQSGTVQSSALVFRGPSPDPSIANHRDLVSYIYKDLSSNFSFRNFGTRMRIIGRGDYNYGQIANGSSNYYSVQSLSMQDTTSLNGGSGGIGIMVNPSNGSGYYFEIVGLTENNLEKYYTFDSTGTETSVVHNILFYKINNKVKTTATTPTDVAIPTKLWGGLSTITVDPGLFAGQDRLALTENSTVYDLNVEYEVLSGGALRFYLYINNILIKIVDDSSPLPITTTTCLFVRSGSECMFENVYALDDLVAKNANENIVPDVSIFDKNGIRTNEFLKKYAMSGIVQSTYLSNISPDTNTRYRAYFEEFGTIMRECAHFNIKYDQAYPSFYSVIAKTFSTDRGYTVSGFYGGAYEAEFLIFNAADKAIVLDETTGNYLRILGITFTQDTSQTLSVDDYFNKLSNFSDPEYRGNEIVSPQVSLEKYNKIKASRSKYGKREFSLESMYIQSEDFAENIMGWIIDKTMRPRREVTLIIFPMPHLQLGDIVIIDYTMPDGKEYVSSSTRFYINDMTYSRTPDSVSQTIKVVEI